MKTILKSAFIFVFAATVSSCNFFGNNPDKPVSEKPTTEVPVDTTAGDAKVEEKKEIDSATVSRDTSKETEIKKETK